MDIVYSCLMSLTECHITCFPGEDWEHIFVWVDCSELLPTAACNQWITSPFFLGICVLPFNSVMQHLFYY